MSEQDKKGHTQKLPENEPIKCNWIEKGDSYVLPKNEPLICEDMMLGREQKGQKIKSKE